jgi:hypothetical protein
MSHKNQTSKPQTWTLTLRIHPYFNYILKKIKISIIKFQMQTFNPIKTKEKP